MPKTLKGLSTNLAGSFNVFLSLSYSPTYPYGVVVFVRNSANHFRQELPALTLADGSSAEPLYASSPATLPADWIPPGTQPCPPPDPNILVICCMPHLGDPVRERACARRHAAGAWSAAQAACANQDGSGLGAALFGREKRTDTATGAQSYYPTGLLWLLARAAILDERVRDGNAGPISGVPEITPANITSYVAYWQVVLFLDAMLEKCLPKVEVDVPDTIPYWMWQVLVHHRIDILLEHIRGPKRELTEARITKTFGAISRAVAAGLSERAERALEGTPHGEDGGASESA